MFKADQLRVFPLRQTDRRCFTSMAGIVSLKNNGERRTIYCLCALFDLGPIDACSTTTDNNFDVLVVGLEFVSDCVKASGMVDKQKQTTLFRRCENDLSRRSMNRGEYAEVITLYVEYLWTGRFFPHAVRHWKPYMQANTQTFTLVPNSHNESKLIKTNPPPFCVVWGVGVAMEATCLYSQSSSLGCLEFGRVWINGTLLWSVSFLSVFRPWLCESQESSREAANCNPPITSWRWHVGPVLQRLGPANRQDYKLSQMWCNAVVLFQVYLWSPRLCLPASHSACSSLSLSPHVSTSSIKTQPWPMLGSTVRNPKKLKYRCFLLWLQGRMWTSFNWI